MSIKVKSRQSIVLLVLEELAPRDKWLDTQVYLDLIENSRIVKNNSELLKLSRPNLTKAAHTGYAILSQYCKCGKISYRKKNGNGEYYIPSSLVFQQVELN